jgi:predicted DNA-binding transcriptional regulator YafY
MAAMSAEDADSARQLGQRLVRFDAPGSPFGRSQRVIEQAIADRRVLNIGYADKNGNSSKRTVEPLAIVGVADRWYLSAWCRLRDDRRVFRFDRISDATLTRELAPPRDLPDIDLEGLVRRQAFE